MSAVIEVHVGNRVCGAPVCQSARRKLTLDDDRRRITRHLAYQRHLAADGRGTCEQSDGKQVCRDGMRRRHEKHMRVYTRTNTRIRNADMLLSYQASTMIRSFFVLAVLPVFLFFSLSLSVGARMLPC